MTGAMRDALWPGLTELWRELLPPEAPWQALRDLEGCLDRLWPREAGSQAVVLEEGAWMDGAHVLARRVWLGKGARVEPTAVLVGGTIVLDEGAVVRAGAYVRGPAYVGPEALVGHATEVKNSILLARAHAPHFAYVGDSILGCDVNLGAGTKISNVRLDGREIAVRWEGRRIPTGLRKLGALVGDGVHTGCNSVLNPGVVLLPGSQVLPCASVRGTPPMAPASARAAFPQNPSVPPVTP